MRCAHVPTHLYESEVNQANCYSLSEKQLLARANNPGQIDLAISRLTFTCSKRNAEHE